MKDVLRSARALGWLRWRLFLNAFKSSRRRDTLEAFTRASSVIVPIILGLMFVPAFLGSCVLSLFGGWVVGQGISVTPVILGAVRMALGAVTALILFVPAIRTAKGASTNLVRLALLPMPRKVLHGAALLSGLSDPWIALLVPVMVLFPLGIMFAGRVLAGAIALLAGIALLGTFLALESSASSLLALLYRDRRRGEIVTLVVLLTLSVSGFMPMFLSGGFDDKGWHRDRRRASEHKKQGSRPAELTLPPLPSAGTGNAGSTGGVGSSGAPEGASGSPEGATGTSGGETGTTGGATATTGGATDPPHNGEATTAPPPPPRRPDEVRFYAATSFLPSELFARALYEPLRGRTGVGLLGLLGVLGIGAALYSLSWTTYRRLLDSPENISPRRGRRAEPSVWKLPGLNASASAVAQAQVRLVMRTVHGKMAIFYTPLSLLIAGFAMTRIGRGGLTVLTSGGFPIGPVYAFAGAAFSLFAPQRFMLNVFAADGAGLTLLLLSPVSERDLVVGKSVGMSIISAIPMLIITVVVAVISPPASIALWATVFVAAISIYLIFAPASAIVSAILPKSVNMNRMSGGSNPNGLASMIGVALTGVSCLTPAAVCLVTYLATRSPFMVLLAAIVYAGVTVALAFLLTHVAAKTVAARRENLALVAQGR